jgi:excisionase family DNA binding protein
MKNAYKPRPPGARITVGTVAPGKGEFLSPLEFGREVRVGLGQVYGAIRAREIKAARIGGQYRIPRSEIERLKRAESVNAADDIAQALEVEAARRNVTVGRLIAQILQTATALPTPPEPRSLPADVRAGGAPRTR